MIPLICAGIIAACGIFFYGYRKRAKLVIPSLGIQAIRRSQLLRCVAALAFLALTFTALFVGASEAFDSQKTGVVAYACDESRSMGAENEEGVSRIERCKQIIQDLDQFPHSIVAVYGFTYRAFSHSSFSADHDHFQKTVRHLVAIEAVPGTGSEIGFSTRNVIEDTAKKRNALGKKAAIVAVISDGESTTREERNDLARAAQYAKNSNVIILAIGVGEDTPSKIPLYEDGKRAGYEKDERGNDLVTKLDETTLRFLAEGSGGMYVREHEIEKARTFLAGALVAEKLPAEGTGSKIIAYLLMAALAPLALLIRLSLI